MSRFKIAFFLLAAISVIPRSNAVADEPDEKHAGQKNTEQKEVAFTELERIIGDVGTANRLPIAFLELGLANQKSVGRVILKATHQVNGELFFPGDGWATGFLVSDTILMTNNHVIPTKSFAKNKARIQFNFQRAGDGSLQETQEFDLNPSGFFHTNAVLDYTLVRVSPRQQPTGNPGEPLVEITPGSQWGHLALGKEQSLRAPEQGQPRQRLAIVQHPKGGMKEIAMHDNFVVSLSTDFVRYTTDTLPGSSGSPVFNELWQLVALHHQAGDYKMRSGEIVWLNNKGVRIDRIVEDLEANLRDRPQILRELGLASE